MTDVAGAWPAHLTTIGAVRFGRRSRHFDRSVALYRDLVGLPVQETFRASYETDGVIFGLPGTSLTLETVRYALDLLVEGTQGVGYLLKDRVGDLGEFTDALSRVAAGGSALDPQVVAHLIAHHRTSPNPLDEITDRERDVLALMAEGRSNHAIARHLVIAESTTEKHIANIFSKLRIPPSLHDHRRVLAVLTHLRQSL